MHPRNAFEMLCTLNETNITSTTQAISYITLGGAQGLEDQADTLSDAISHFVVKSKLINNLAKQHLHGGTYVQATPNVPPTISRQLEKLKINLRK
jgi:hypothetical protein